MESKKKIIKKFPFASALNKFHKKEDSKDK